MPLCTFLLESDPRVRLYYKRVTAGPKWLPNYFRIISFTIQDTSIKFFCHWLDFFGISTKHCFHFMERTKNIYGQAFSLNWAFFESARLKFEKYPIKWECLQQAFYINLVYFKISAEFSSQQNFLKNTQSSENAFKKNAKS